MESLVILFIVVIIAVQVIVASSRRDVSRGLRQRRRGHPAARRRAQRRTARERREAAPRSTATVSSTSSGSSQNAFGRTMRARQFGRVVDVDDVDEGTSLEHPGGDSDLEELLARDDFQHRFDYSTRHRVRTWSLRLDQRSVLDGIIFSQILGPPRARQPLLQRSPMFGGPPPGGKPDSQEPKS